ncbi:MAG: glycerol-3-phosphate acyltransferase [Bacteroides sp.]
MFDKSIFVMVLIFCFAGYMCGSFLSAYFIPKWLYGIDITLDSPDKNPGAANAFKNAGTECGILVIVTELLKGFLPVYIASHYIDVNSLWFIPVMAAPVIGHAHSLFYGFKGGKAIAVSFGVLIGLVPNLIPALWLAFFYIFFSLVIKINPHWKRSIVTFINWCVALAVTCRVKSICFAAVIISAIVVHKHMLAKDV